MTTIPLEKVREFLEFRKFVDSVDLKDIVWTVDGSPLPVSNEAVEYWRLVGLSNMYFAEQSLLG